MLPSGILALREWQNSSCTQNSFVCRALIKRISDSRAGQWLLVTVSVLGYTGQWVHSILDSFIWNTQNSDWFMYCISSVLLLFWAWTHTTAYTKTDHWSSKVSVVYSSWPWSSKISGISYHLLSTGATRDQIGDLHAKWIPSNWAVDPLCQQKRNVSRSHYECDHTQDIFTTTNLGILTIALCCFLPETWDQVILVNNVLEVILIRK